jgi:hypothetical protein
MNSVWRSLLWKEWREHRLAAGALLTVATVIAAVYWRDDAQGFFGGLMGLLVFFMPVYAMFLATGIATGEQSRGNIRFLQSQPSPYWKHAVAKLTVVSVIVALPGLTLALLGWFAQDFVAIPPDSVTAGFAFAYVALSLLIWMAAVGVNRGDEVRAGMWGLLVMGSVWAAISFFVYRGDHSHEWPSYLRIISAAAPAGLSVLWDAESRLEFNLGMFAMIVSHAALVACYILRFGHDAPATFQAVVLKSHSPSKKAPWLAPPRGSPIQALVWKQLRETAPLAGLGGATIIVVSLAIAAAIDRQGTELFSEGLLTAVSISWLMVGMFVAIVTGIGVFLDDLKPGLHAFWRSRPVSVTQWFVVKLTVGALVTIVLLAAAPALLVPAIKLLDPGAKSLSRADFPEPGLVIGLQGAMFLVAVAAVAVTRNAVYAAILTISVLVVCVASAEKFHLSLTTGLWSATAGVMTSVVIAWLAVRNDWGWKSR